LEEEEGGYYVLVEDTKGTIEKLGAGVYRDTSNRTVLERIADTTTYKGVRAVPVKVVESKIRLRKLTERVEKHAEKRAERKAKEAEQAAGGEQRSQPEPESLSEPESQSES